MGMPLRSFCLLSVLYSLFAAGQWWAARDAANTAQNTLKEMQLSARPWVGMVNRFRVHEEPIFEVSSNIPDSTAIVVPISFDIRNVGSSPAFGTATDAFFAASTGRSPPENIMEMVCSFALENSEAGRGNTILPGGEIRMDYGLNQPYPIKFSDIFIAWISVCIVYKDSQQSIHYTRYWLKTGVSEDILVPLPQRDMFSRYRLPASEWSIHSSNAD
jgi:hypothetical protein